VRRGWRDDGGWGRRFAAYFAGFSHRKL
jgi:hypothetical protein